MPAKIDAARLIGYNASANDAFLGGEVAQGIYSELSCVRLPEKLDEASIFVKMIFDLTAGKLVLSSDITWQFQLSPVLEIQPEDVYKCIELTTAHLQEILSSVYSHQRSAPNIQGLSYESSLPQIREILDHLGDK